MFPIRFRRAMRVSRDRCAEERLLFVPRCCKQRYQNFALDLRLPVCG